MNDALDAVRAIMGAPEDIDLPNGMDAQDTPHPDADVRDFASYGPDDFEGRGGDDPPEVIDPLEAALRDCSAMPLNDYGNGCRFVRHFGQDLLFVGQVGWHGWDGARWLSDDEISRGLSPRVRGYAQSLGALIEKEVPYIQPSPEDAAMLGEERGLMARQRELARIDSSDEAVKMESGVISARLKAIEAALKGHKTIIGRRITHAKNAGNSGPLSNMSTEASVMVSRRLAEMDASALDVNTASGVLRFEVTPDEVEHSFLPEGSPMPMHGVVRLLPHDREHLLTKMMPVDYDPDAKAPLFEAFLARVQPNYEMRAFLQRWFGLSLTGLTGEQKLVFLYGSGANGKSVLVDLMAKLMGDYSAVAKIESLTGRNKRGGGDATPDLVPLIGARMVRASEPEEGERFQEGLIKELTGGEPILVRALHSDFVEVKPQFKLTISGNHKPTIRGTDDGIWRRVLLVPFDVQIPKEERDPLLGQKLWTEASGILNWLRDGLIDYLTHGLREPDLVLEATREFREESDPVGNFLEQCCICTGSDLDTIPSRELGEAFNYWLDQRGDDRWRSRTISIKLKEKSERWKSPKTGHGFVARKSSVMAYGGIRFTDLFGTPFKNAPRDTQGRVIVGRQYSEAESEG